MIEFGGDSNISNWFIDKGKPWLIAGPCSAETEEQVMQTALALKNLGRVSVFRAGIWKPRTRPGEFEGAGSKALGWLQRVKREIGLPVATEVATARHVEEALNAGIDFLWIGARTTVNPFSVQELADALQGTDIPVLVKNPVNPDFGLWVGALERLHRAGIGQLGAVHRGFSSFETIDFRNDPMWEMAVNLRTHYPNLPVFVDPSHICGRRDLIPYVCQKAMDLDMHGLMIETHISPNEAWTDAKQQVTPAEFAKILDSLILRASDSCVSEFSVQLDKLRKEIDKIDDQLLLYFSRRMHLSEEIGKLKKENNLTVLQVARWEEMMSRRSVLANGLNLDETFVRSFWELLHKESIRRQALILDNKSV